MEPDTLPQRVTRYLLRHIAHLEQGLRAVQALELKSPEAVTRFLAAQARHDTLSAQFDAEQAALLKEWHADTSVSPEERQAVRALALRGEALNQQLAAAYDAAAALALSTAGMVELQANALRRGAGVARKFSFTGEDAGGYIDRHA